MADNRTLGGHSIAYIAPTVIGPPDGDDTMDERMLRVDQGKTARTRQATVASQHAKMPKSDVEE